MKCKILSMNRKYYKILTFILAIGILVISSIPETPGPAKSIPYLHEMTHFSEFFILSVLLLKSYSISFKNKRIVYFVLGIGIGYSLLVETYQFFLPWRAFEFYDIGINSLGVLTGGYVYMNFIKRFEYGKL